MTDIFSIVLRIHLTCALGATAAFWAAGLSAKGETFHRGAGRWFARLIYAAAATGGGLALAGLLAPGWGHPVNPSQSIEMLEETRRATRQTMWLVLYVLVIIVAPVQHGLAAVTAGPTPSRVRSKRHAALNLAAMAGTVAILAASVVWSQWIFLTIAPIGFLVGLRNLRYVNRPAASSSVWEREHLTSMITAGITLHTAFFVFASSRSLALTLEGWMRLVPWTLPALIGVPIIFWMRGRR